MNDVLLTLITFFPMLGMTAILCLPSNKTESIKTIAAVATAIPLLLTLWLYFGAFSLEESAVASLQLIEQRDWISAFNIQYLLGVDGISLPLVFLTTLLLFIAVFASWNIEKGVKGYFALLLLLEVGITGVFVSLDLFLFYVFWEIMLLPMYFLIGVWGGPRREYAAIKFFLYTLAGSVLMLVALIALYLGSGRSNDELIDGKVVAELRGAPDAVSAVFEEGLVVPAYDGRGGDRIAEERYDFGELSVISFLDRATVAMDRFEREGGNVGAGSGVRAAMTQLAATQDWVRQKRADLQYMLEDNSILLVPLDKVVRNDNGTIRRDDSLPRAARPSFDIRAIQALAKEDLIGGSAFLSWSLLGMHFHQWIFIFLFISFAIKIPVFPFHTWLPDAHVEAPTAISVILAGILLKLGAYGMMRINFPLVPEGFHEYATPMAILGLINIIYGAFVAMAQTDFKRLVAYSSVSHMGYVLLGMAALTEFGMNGAALQLFNHGTSSAMLFLIVGVIYDRAHHRDLNKFGGLMKQMPYYGGLTTLGFFAALGLPGLAGFISEAMTLIGAYATFPVIAP